MDISSVGAASIQMSLAKVQESASLSIMKKAMDAQQQGGNAIVQSIQAANPPAQRLNVLA